MPAVTRTRDHGALLAAFPQQQRLDGRARRPDKKARTGRASWRNCRNDYLIETAATFSSGAASLFLSATCLAAVFEAGTFSAVVVGALVAAGTGVAASWDGGVAEAEVDASWDPQSAAAGMVRLNNASAVTADAVFMASSG